MAFYEDPEAAKGPSYLEDFTKNFEILKLRIGKLELQLN